MFLQPKDSEMYALALALENGLMTQDKNPMALQIAEATVDRYMDNALKALTKDGMYVPLTAKTIKLLSPTELWALNYLAVKKVVGSNKSGQTAYTLQCAINNFRDKNPGNESQMERLNYVEVTNIVFATEFDMFFAIIAMEHLFDVFALMEASKATSTPSVTE